MKIRTLLDIVERIFPPRTAVLGDRLGLQVSLGNKEIKKLLISYELTQEVALEAVEGNFDCIISFHPLIYEPLKQITSEDRTGAILSTLIKNDISLIVIHTNFDANPKGTNHLFASALGLEIIDLIEENEFYDGFGMGLICKSNDPLNQDDFLRLISSKLNTPLRYCEGQDKPIRNIGFVCGSGSSFLNEGLVDKLDAFITADIKYHSFHQFKGKLMLIDPGHWEMERFVPSGLMAIISQEIGNIFDEIALSRIYTNPIRYYPNTDEYLQRQKNTLLFNNEMVSFNGNTDVLSGSTGFC